MYTYINNEHTSIVSSVIFKKVLTNERRVQSIPNKTPKEFSPLVVAEGNKDFLTCARNAKTGQ